MASGDAAAETGGMTSKHIKLTLPAAEIPMVARTLLRTCDVECCCSGFLEAVSAAEAGADSVTVLLCQEAVELCSDAALDAAMLAPADSGTMTAALPPGMSERDAVLRTVRLHPHELDLLAQAIEAEAAATGRAGDWELHDLMMCRAADMRREAER